MTGGAPLYRAHEWAGRGAMCFREAAFASHWSEVAKLAWAPPANCGHSSILRAFRLRVMRSMHALDYSPPSGQLKLVYSRRGVAHMNKKGLRRRVLNEEELLVKMAAAYPDVAVTPTDINGRLRVWVAAHDPAISPAQALARLQAARSWLRSEVAAAISRRRVPDLTFEWYLPEGTP